MVLIFFYIMTKIEMNIIKLFGKYVMSESQ
jgi:hypothetical protein